MKKLFITLLLTALIGAVLPFGNSFNVVEASDSYYPMACSANEFEVSYIENNGSLSKVSCHSNFADAKNKMKQNEDYVVRYKKSYSPTNIIAMNSGLAYTYPGRRNSLTMYIYQNISANIGNQNNYKYTYLTENYEMTYYDTLTDYSGNIAEYGKGYIKVTMNGFDGYCELEYTDLVPRKYIENNIPIYVGGNNTYTDEDPYKVRMHQNYYQIEQNGNYKDLVFHYFRSYPDYSKSNDECLSNVLYCDNAQNYLDAGMKTGVKYYSNDGINFYSDPELKKFVAQVYGYYEFLSVRSKTNISGKTFDKFLESLNKTNSQMKNEGQSFINAQNNYGSNALIIYAMACQESGYGTSYYSSDRFNLFGWGAYDSNPGHASGYESIEQCVNQQMGRNLDWFMDCTNWRYAGTCVGNKGTGFNMQYASDPYWGIKIASLAYRIDKFANNNNGNLSDYNAYTIGVVDSNYNPSFGINTSDWNTTIYKNSTGSSSWHTSKFNNNYQKDLTIAITGSANNRYKINLANPVVNGSLFVDSGICEYDWNTSVGYIDANRVTILNGEPEKEKGEATYEPFTSLRSVTISDNILTIKGVGGIQGLDFNKNDSSIKHEVVFYDMKDPSISYKFDAANTSISGYNLNDGYNYDLVGFELNVNLADGSLPMSTYNINLITTNADRSAETVLKSPLDDYSNIQYKNNNSYYRITTNYLYNYRIELDMFNSGLDYLKINKPSTRQSLVTFENMTISEDGILDISAHGMIYYLNYDNVDNISYNVYLVKDDGTVITGTTELVENKLDYKKQFNSSYNLDHISFKSSFDLNGIYGTYDIMLEINNGEYCDFVEFTNMAGLDMPVLQNENYDISILTSSVRDKLYLVSNEVGEGA